MKFLKPRLSEFAKMEYKYRPYVLDLIKQTKMGLMIEGKSVMTDLLKDVWRIIRGLDPESEQCMNFKVLSSFSNYFFINWKAILFIPCVIAPIIQPPFIWSPRLGAVKIRDGLQHTMYERETWFDVDVLIKSWNSWPEHVLLSPLTISLTKFHETIDKMPKTKFLFFFIRHDTWGRLEAPSPVLLELEDIFPCYMYITQKTNKFLLKAKFLVFKLLFSSITGYVYYMYYIILFQCSTIRWNSVTTESKNVRIISLLINEYNH